MLKLPIIAQLQKASPWNVPLSGVKGGGGGSGGGSVVRVGSGRSPFISRLQTPQSGMSHFAQVGYLIVVLSPPNMSEKSKLLLEGFSGKIGEDVLALEHSVPSV